LDQEYLAVLETNQGTPYFLNLHHQDNAHTVILGATGAGNTTLLTSSPPRHAPTQFEAPTTFRSWPSTNRWPNSPLEPVLPADGVQGSSWSLNPSAIGHTPNARWDAVNPRGALRKRLRATESVKSIIRTTTPSVPSVRQPHR